MAGKGPGPSGFSTLIGIDEAARGDSWGGAGAIAHPATNGRIAAARAIAVRMIFLTTAFHERDRRLEELRVLLVPGRVLAIDLDPLARARRAAGLERNHVLPRELQLRRVRDEQAQPDAVAADAREHAVVHEVGVEVVELLPHDAGELQEDRVDLRLAARFGRGRGRFLFHRAIVRGFSQWPSFAMSSSAAFGPHVPRRYVTARGCLARTGSMAAHAASTASSRVKSPPLPAIASERRRSYGDSSSARSSRRYSSFWSPMNLSPPRVTRPASATAEFGESRKRT